MTRQLILVLATLAVCGCGGPKERPRDAAEQFFRMCAQGKIKDAYAQASTTFRLTRSAEYFEARIFDLGLDTMKNVEWGEPEARDRTARLRGKFELADGRKFALNISFLMENGRWRLLEARTDPAPSAGAPDDVFAVAARSIDTVRSRATDFTEPVAASMPSESQLRKLAEATLLKFDEAIRVGGDFTALYNDASARWKYRGKSPRELATPGRNAAGGLGADPFNDEKRLTVEGMRRAFEPAVLARIDLSPIKGRKMTLSEPARINSEGVLLLKGTFDAVLSQGPPPGISRKLEFFLEYVFEGSQWKLYGISVHLTALPAAELPQAGPIPATAPPRQPPTRNPQC